MSLARCLVHARSTPSGFWGGQFSTNKEIRGASGACVIINLHKLVADRLVMSFVILFINISGVR
jgi:hypothetical protein